MPALEVVPLQRPSREILDPPLVYEMKDEIYLLCGVILPSEIYCNLNDNIK